MYVLYIHIYIYIYFFFLGDCVDFIESVSNNKLAELDDLATSIDFLDEEDIESDGNSKRKSPSTKPMKKKQRMDKTDQLGNSPSIASGTNAINSDSEIATQDIANEIESESSGTEIESDYEY